jgi:hypothetical protein
MVRALIIGYGKLGSHLYHALKKTGRLKPALIKIQKAG